MAAQPGGTQESNLQAFVEADILSQEAADQLETQKRQAINEMPQYVVQMLIGLYNNIGEVAGSRLI